MISTNKTELILVYTEICHGSVLAPNWAQLLDSLSASNEAQTLSDLITLKKSYKKVNINYEIFFLRCKTQ